MNAYAARLTAWPTVAGAWDRLIEWSILALLAVVPLGVALGQPLQGFKSVLLQVGAFGLVACMLMRGQGLRLPAAAWWAAGLVATATLLATLFSVDHRLSLIGSEERGEGLVAVLAMLVLFAASAAIFRQDGQIGRLALTVGAVGTLAAAYALLQAAGLDVLNWTADGRPFATFGNSDFLAGYLAMSLPLSVWALRRWPRCLVAAATVQGLGLLASGGRAAAFGLLLAGSIALVLSGRRVLGAVLIGALLPLAVLAAVLIRPTSLAARPFIWQQMPAVIAAHPLTGTGPETLPLVLWSRAVPGDLSGYADGAYNAELDVLASTGVAGLAAYGFAAFAIARALLAAYRQPATAGAALALGVALLAHLIASQASIESISAQALTWALCGAVIALPALQTRRG